MGAMLPQIGMTVGSAALNKGMAMMGPDTQNMAQQPMNDPMAQQRQMQMQLINALIAQLQAQQQATQVQQPVTPSLMGR